jgi:hypothetical protein
MHTPKGKKWVDFDKISTVGDLKEFITTTVAY